MKKIGLAILFSVMFATIPLDLYAADPAGWLGSGVTTKWNEVHDGRRVSTNGYECEYNPALPVRDRAGYMSTIVEDITIKACVTRGKYVNIAYAMDQGQYSGGAAYKYASFAGDTRMYPLEIPGEPTYSYYDFRLVKGQDSLIIESSGYGGWFIYDNLSSRLVKSTTPGTSNTIYTLDRSNTTHRFSLPVAPQSPEHYLYQRGVGYSKNGRYFAFAANSNSWSHASQMRYYLLDSTTGEAKLFSVAEKDTTNSVQEQKRFTVSDDGKYVAGGTMLTFSIWNTDGCGVAMSSSHDGITADPCPSVVIGKPQPSNPRYTDYGGDLYSWWRTSLFEFTDNDRSISFAAFQQGYSSTRYSIAAPGYTPDRLGYLALGDSYSSGEGDTYIDPHTNSKRYREHTNVEEDAINPREKCHLSTQSYPYKLASSFSWNLADQNNIAGRWQSVACSGAQKYDANEYNSAYYMGQGKGAAKQLIVNERKPRLQGYANAAQLKVDALNEFIPGRQKQIEFVKKYKPKVITLTMGGNDVGFGDKISMCIFLSTTCSTATEEERKLLGHDIKGQFSKLTSFYRELQLASPGVRIYVLGYPQAITDGENDICPSNADKLNYLERKMIVAGYWYMNQVIHTAARAQGVHYVDTQWALTGHRLCEAGNNPYVIGLVAFNNKTKDEVQETFHPNADGHSLIANKFYEALNYKNPLTYNGYASDANASLTEADIPHSLYLQTDTTATRNVEHKASTDSEQVRSSSMSITFDSFTFLAGSTVQMTLHSDPVDLGTMIASSNGAASATPTIPSTVPPGYHTLVVSGQTPSGEDIEYEQIILVKGEDPDDIDDNNVPDDQQVCGPFITPSSEDEDYDGIDDACDPEVTDPILYIARNGATEKGEDSSKLYVYRNTRASGITGITTDYVDISTDADNKEALVASSLDTSTSATYNRFIMLQDTNNPNIKIPIIFAKDINSTCIALQPTDYLSPVLNPTDSNYALRGFTKLTQLPAGENCE